MRIQKIYLTLFALLCFSTYIFSQDVAAKEEKKEEKTFTLSGSVDTYFHTSLGTDQDAPGTSFANLNGFSLGMVNLIGYRIHHDSFYRGYPAGIGCLFCNPVSKIST